MRSAGQHHLHKKTSSERRLLEVAVMIVAIAEPLMTIPQIYTIWTSKNAAGVSLLTWALYVGASLVWFVYGMAVKNRPLAVTGALWILVELGVIIGILKYR